MNEKLSKNIQEVTNMAKEMEPEEVVVFLLLVMRELVDIIVLYSHPNSSMDKEVDGPYEEQRAALMKVMNKVKVVGKQ